MSLHPCFKTVVFAALWVALSAAPARSEKAMMSGSNYILDHPNLSRKVSLALNDTNIVDALIYLSEKAEINVAVSKSVEGRATLSLNDVSIRDALDIILLSNDLAMEKRGEIFYVMPAADYEVLHGERWSEARQVRMFKLQFARSEDVVRVLDTLKSKVGSVVIDAATGTVVVMDTPEKVAQIGETIAELDRQRENKVINLQYANAKEVETNLITRLNEKGVGTVLADEKYNRLVVSALPGKMGEIEKLIRELDTKIKQVLIEAKIVRVKLTPAFEMGVDWEKLMARAPLSVTSHFPADTALSRVGSLSINQLGTIDIDLTIKLLETAGETKLLSSPRISALNNEEASIFVGTRDFYTTSTTTQGSGTAQTAIEITFLDIGVTFKVTPVINDEGFVLMKIKPEVSRVDERREIATGDLIPVVDTTTAETRVMVKDGNTIIIGGLIRDEFTRDTEKFPMLGDLPLVGRAFRHTREDTVKTELVVFLTPHIIDGAKDMTEFDKKKPKSLKGYDNA